MRTIFSRITAYIDRYQHIFSVLILVGYTFISMRGNTILNDNYYYFDCFVVVAVAVVTK